MKIHKMITIDVDLAERLNKEENASGLISSLLRKYFLEFATKEELLKMRDERIAEAKQILETFEVKNG